MTNKITRRKFMKIAALAAGAMTVPMYAKNAHANYLQLIRNQRIAEKKEKEKKLHIWPGLIELWEWQKKVTDFPYITLIQ